MTTALAGQVGKRAVTGYLASMGLMVRGERQRRCGERNKSKRDGENQAGLGIAGRTSPQVPSGPRAFADVSKGDPKVKWIAPRSKTIDRSLGAVQNCVESTFQLSTNVARRTSPPLPSTLYFTRSRFPSLSPNPRAALYGHDARSRDARGFAPRGGMWHPAQRSPLGGRRDAASRAVPPRVGRKAGCL